MTFIDLGALLRIEHEARKEDHLQTTNVTTQLHMSADRAEEDGNRELADAHRATAHELQMDANKRWFQSN